MQSQKQHLEITEQIDCLIEAARDPQILGRAWIGWGAYIWANQILQDKFWRNNCFKKGHDKGLLQWNSENTEYNLIQSLIKLLISH